MDEILHYLANPEMMIPPVNAKQTSVSTMVSTCEMGFATIHSTSSDGSPFKTTRTKKKQNVEHRPNGRLTFGLEKPDSWGTKTAKR